MTTRRYLMCFAIAQGEDFSFMNTTVTIEGDLEQGIAKVKQRAVNDLAKDGIYIAEPVLLSAIPLENVLPPQFVLLPIEVRRSVEQIVIDHRRGELSTDNCIRDIATWLETVKEKQ